MFLAMPELFFELALCKVLLCLGSCVGGKTEPDVCQILMDFYLYILIKM